MIAYAARCKTAANDHALCGFEHSDKMDRVPVFRRSNSCSPSRACWTGAKPSQVVMGDLAFTVFRSDPPGIRQIQSPVVAAYPTCQSTPERFDTSREHLLSV